MKITNEKLMASIPFLSEVGKLKLPAKTSYRVSKALRLLNTAAEDFERARITAAKNYALKDEEGNPIVDDKGIIQMLNQVGFLHEMQELMAEEIEVPVLPVKLEDLGDQSVTVRALAELDWLIVE